MFLSISYKSVKVICKTLITLKAELYLVVNDSNFLVPALKAELHVWLIFLKYSMTQYLFVIALKVELSLRLIL
jgi:hypothetical protein